MSSSDSEEIRVSNRQPVELSWKDINYSIKTKKKTKKILDDIHGLVPPGSFVAILGPSGAGKTTLLNALAGRLGSVEGSVMMNRKELDKKSFKKLSGFVTQEDVMLAWATVYEVLIFSAKMRLPKDMPLKDKEKRVDKIIQDLGLSKVRDSLIGDTMTRGVSGGEKKRVSIGRELVTDPSILFLDEPTSGLDASTAMNLVESLAELAHKDGRTVITTIHQPRASIMEQFDQVILMAQGEIAYFGKYQDSIPYFSNLGFECPTYVNPADFFLDVLASDTRSEETARESEKRITTVVSHFNENVKPGLREMVHETQSRVPTSPKMPKSNKISAFEQTYHLIMRNAKAQIRNVKVILVKCFISILLAVFTGLLYLQIDNDQKSVNNRNGFLFFAVLQHAFPEMNAVLVTFPPEKPLFLHERSTGTYRILPYIASKVISEFPVQAVGPLLFSSISYWMIGLQANVSDFLFFFFALLLTTQTASSMCYAVGSLVTISLIAPIATLIMVLSMVFSGFFVLPGDIPPYFIWLYYSSFVKWTLEIVFIGEYEGLDLECEKEDQCLFRTGEDVLEFYSMDDSRVWISVVVLVGIIILFRVMTYFGLRFVAPRTGV